VITVLVVVTRPSGALGFH